MEQRCVIFSAGPVSGGMKALLSPDDYIIACDAGYLRAEALGVVPDLVVGDFDSAPRPKGGASILLPTEKDDTDTQYAARLALERGFKRVLLLGALGGARLEHGLANLATGLWLAKRGVEVRLANEQSLLQFVLPGLPVVLQHAPGCYFSIFPIEGAATGVCERGAKYPLENAALTPDYPVGVSNETLPGETVISVQTGSLLLIQTQKDTPAHKSGSAGI